MTLDTAKQRIESAIAQFGPRAAPMIDQAKVDRDHLGSASGDRQDAPVYQMVFDWRRTASGTVVLVGDGAFAMTGLEAAANLRLAEGLADAPGAYLLDSQRWLSSVANPGSPKLWYAAKVPYRPEVFAAAAADVIAAMDALAGRSRRLVIVDLDDTLVVHNRLNTELVQFLYQCVNNRKRIVLISKHLGPDIHAYLRQWKVAALFDEVIWLKEEQSKADHIASARAIFIEDSFSQRAEVAKRCGIPTFDPSMIEALIDDRI
mgnify:CR=1 FL=1